MKKARASRTPATDRKRRASARRKEKEYVVDTDADTLEDHEGEGLSPVGTSGAPISRGRVLLILTLLLLGFLIYRYRYLLTPATVNGQPIFITEYLKGLHTTFGREYIDTLTTQKAIEQEIERSNVEVSSEEIDTEIDRIDKQASASGGIQAILENTSMEELRKQVRIQLAVKKILNDKIQVTDAEVNDAFEKNKDFFKGRPEQEVRNLIREQLETQKFQTEAQNWLNELKGKTQIDIRFPGLQAT